VKIRLYSQELNGHSLVERAPRRGYNSDARVIAAAAKSIAAQRIGLIARGALLNI
jgi:hypothetical protein